jgi:hypothetical protein
MYCGNLGSGRANVQSARSAVIANSAIGHIRCVVVINIHISYNVHIHIVNSAVIGEAAIVPVASVIAAAYIPKTIIDAAVESDVGAPVAAVPAIAGFIEVPIGRGPERAHIWRNNPYAGNPVIACRGVAPIARCPFIVVAGAGRLAVFGKRGRRVWSVHCLLVRCLIVPGIV